MEKIKLNNKLECPVVGIGTFMLQPIDAQFVHMSGTVQSKAQYLKDIEMGRLDYKHTELKDVEVTIEGEYSCIKCGAYLTATAYGATGTFPMNVKSWFQKVDGEWKYISKK